MKQMERSLQINPIESLSILSENILIQMFIVTLWNLLLVKYSFGLFAIGFRNVFNNICN